MIINFGYVIDNRTALCVRFKVEVLEFAHFN